MTSNIKMPQEVLFIISTLNSSHYEAYAVGGCVRDSLLGIEPKDWDITTSAKPLEIKALFNKTVDTGIQHGTVTVVINGKNFEVTTFRVDGNYLDNRRPENVHFTSNLIEDLSRRDFTINAMAYHPEKGLVDLFYGLIGLENKTICTVGDANLRFTEDALRMLRAIRFSAQLDFDIEEQTLRAISHNKNLLSNISHERVRDELTKTLISDNPKRFELLHKYGLLKIILPEFDNCFFVVQNNPYHVYNVAMHTLEAVSNIEKDSILRWTMLLHDIGKAVTRTTDEHGIDHFYGHPSKSVRIADKLLRRLRFDNRSISKILRLVEHHDRSIEPACKAIRRAIAAVGDDIFPDLLKVQAADKRAQNPEYLESRMLKLAEIERIYFDIKSSKHCLSIKDLAINGNDLISLGYTSGKEIGEKLKELFELVLENPALNNKESLIALIKNNAAAF